MSALIGRRMEMADFVDARSLRPVAALHRPVAATVNADEVARSTTTTVNMTARRAVGQGHGARAQSRAVGVCNGAQPGTHQFQRERGHNDTKTEVFVTREVPFHCE